MTEASSEAPASGSVTDYVYDRILAELVTVRILPGERMTVDALARSLKVSQTPIRGALGRLEADGLVSKTHLRGYRATPMLTPREFAEMYELRLLLEPPIARRAARVHTEEHLREIRRTNEQLIEVHGQFEDPSQHSQFAVLDAKLHDLVAEASGNAIIRTSLARVRPHLHIYRLRRIETVVADAIDEHARLIDALTRRDGNMAAAAMKSHIERSYDRVLKYLGETPPPLDLDLTARSLETFTQLSAPMETAS